MRYALLIALWIVWCSIHSILISNRVTESLRKRFAENFRFYRLAFNLFSALTLVPIVFYEISIRSEPIVAWYGIWHIVPVLLSTAGIVLLLAGALRYDLLQFLGLRQVASEDACSVLTDPSQHGPSHAHIGFCSIERGVRAREASNPCGDLPYFGARG